MSLVKPSNIWPIRSIIHSWDSSPLGGDGFASRLVASSSQFVVQLRFCHRGGWCTGSDLDSYSWGTEFELRPGHGCRDWGVFMLFFISLQENSEMVSRLDDDGFLPNSSESSFDAVRLRYWQRRKWRSPLQNDAVNSPYCISVDE
jgi:hypothetical protein